MSYSEDDLDVLIRRALREYDDSKEMAELMALDDSQVVHDRRYQRRKRQALKMLGTSGKKETDIGDTENRHVICIRHPALFRLAAVVLILMSMIFVMIMGVSAFRSAMWNVVAKWYEEYIALSFAGSINTVEASAPDDAESDTSTVPDTVDMIRKPTLLPEGVEEEILSQSSSSIVINYAIMGEPYIGYKQSLLDSEYCVNSEDIEIRNVTIGKNPGKLFLYPDSNLIMWSDEQHLYIISGAIDAEQIIAIAESVS